MRRSERPRRAADLLVPLRYQWATLRDLGLNQALGLNLEMVRARAASRSVLRDGYYRLMSERDLRTERSLERAFVYGSGYSLNELTSDEWRRMSDHTTIGFNQFIYQEWVNVDFHLVRGWGLGSSPRSLRKVVDEFGSQVALNPRYSETVFVYQDDYSAMFAHRLLGFRGLPQGARIFPYHTNRTSQLPSRAMSEGLVHATSVLCDAVNFASCMGFKEIVLVGVDLYDSRYFWIDREKTVATDDATGELVVGETSFRGQRVDEPHSTVANGIVGLMANWYEQLGNEGIKLVVYNHRSLLADVMPVYDPMG